MENRPSFINSQFCQDYSEQYTHHIHPSLGSYNPQFSGDQSQFLSQINPTQRSIANNKNSQAIRKERDPNWSQEEEEALCKSWLHVSEDPITGSDQPRQRLWDRILYDFNKRLGQETGRDSTSLSNIWAKLHPKFNKYSGFVDSVQRNPSSGYTIADSMGLVDQLYQQDQKHRFKWYSCWILLKDTAKWYNFVTEQNEKKKKMTTKKRKPSTVDIDGIEYFTNPSTPVTNPSPDSVGEEDISLNQQSSELERPIGRKAAKDMPKNKNIDQVKAINLFAEGFGNLIKDQKEISKKEIRMSNERERMKIEAKQDRERMRIDAKKEQEKLRHEKEIMMMDPNSAPTEEGKSWIIAQQKTILSRLQKVQDNDLSDSVVN